MQGDSSLGNIATIVRNGSVGFSFMDMVNFNIYYVAFTSYNRSWSYASHPASNSALLLKSTQHVTLVKCSFSDNLGTALMVHNTSITLAENKFIHNQCECQSFNGKCTLGCGVSAVNSELTFTRNTNFLKISLCCTYTFSRTSNFINSAWFSDGAIYTSNNTVLTFTGTNNFISNHGGVIFTLEHVLTFNGTNNFIINSAGLHDGGAICASTNITLTFIGTNDFSNN